MKKILILALIATSFYGCQNLKPIKTIKDKIVEEYNQETLIQEEFFLNDSGVKYVLDIINSNINFNKLRNYEVGSSFSVYLGENLNIPVPEIIDKIILVSGPKIGDYETVIINNRFNFRSKYQGKYMFNIEKNGIIIKTISINNKSKYKITSEDLKNIIFENYSNKKLEELKNSVSLFKFYFPNNIENKSISMLLFDLATMERNEAVVKNQGIFILNTYKLTEQEKMRILSSQEKVLKDYSIPEKELNFNENSLEFNDFLVREILKRNNPQLKEAMFLEEMYSVVPSQELAISISNFYYKLGNLEKGAYYSNSKNGVLPRGLANLALINKNNTRNTIDVEETNEFYSEYKRGVKSYNEKSYAETILILEKLYILKEEFEGKENIPFYLGNAYLKSNNLERAKENFLLLEENNRNYPEAMYRLGEIYYKLGQKELSMKKFEENKEKFSGTIWGRKSSIYLLKLK